MIRCDACTRCLLFTRLSPENGDDEAEPSQGLWNDAMAYLMLKTRKETESF